MLKPVTFLVCVAAFGAERPIEPPMVSDELIRKAARAGPEPPVGETCEALVGSKHVPINSWIYPALDPLAALGLTPSQAAALRPWTDLACPSQTLEVDEVLRDKADELGDSLADQVRQLVGALGRELEAGNRHSFSTVPQPVSVRNGAIAGPVLNESFHFGQTWSNDFDRPFRRRRNSSPGVSARAGSRCFFASVRAEYEHALGGAPYPLQSGS